MDSGCKCGCDKVDHRFGRCYGCGKCNRWRGQLKPLKKMSTSDFRARLAPLPDDYTMCWGAVLSTFGADYERRPGKSQAQYITNNLLRAAGYAVESVRRTDIMPDVTQSSSYTLAALLPRILTGDWVIGVPGHVLCVRDGKITDTMGWHQTVARRVCTVYRVIHRESAVITLRNMIG